MKTHIDPQAIYFTADLCRLFGFTVSTLKTARRRTGLRTGRRMGKNYVLGEWLLAWFQSGELRQGEQSSRNAETEVNCRPLERQDLQKVTPQAKEGE